jgi:UDP-N-acetyl-D-mannosaminuronate dehydrogenase
VDHHNQLRQCHHQIVNIEEEVRVLARENLNINYGHKELLHSTIAVCGLELKTSVQDAKKTERRHYVNMIGHQKKMIRISDKN